MVTFLGQLRSELKMIKVDYGTRISVFSSLQLRHWGESCTFCFSIAEQHSAGFNYN